jgi:sigma-B regulation protein RsbU (phosphoserine phosphatase)
VERLPFGPGLALGLAEQIPLDEREVNLGPGDTLLFYTDGMTDCRDPHGEAFGLERIKAELRGMKGQSAQQICDNLLETLKGYQKGAPQDDDVTLVAVHSA